MKTKTYTVTHQVEITYEIEAEDEMEAWDIWAAHHFDVRHTNSSGSRKGGDVTNWETLGTDIETEEE